MSFEVLRKDVLARIGRIETKTARIETPHLYPVINPAVQPILPREIYERFKCDAIIVNAYLVLRRLRDTTERPDIHNLLDFPGVVATDSGAYQILEYGQVDVDPLEIVTFQEDINSDVATILDVPTGSNATRDRAEWTVRETLRRADESLKAMRRQDILWVGPIQGGLYLDLVAMAAREMARKPYAIYALGSPTVVMEEYRFADLVDMILTAKMNLPLGKPLHLFGAGHPMMLPLATALGCDIFDSAAYAIFARDGRYLTSTGTLKLDSLKYFPCSCPECTAHEPDEIRTWLRGEVEAFLAKHNLHVCMAEMRAIKQAIVDGRLWELAQNRAQSHPSLKAAMRRLKDYSQFIERHSPSTKLRGIFYFDAVDLYRPEVVAHKRRIAQCYEPPRRGRILLLVPKHVEGKPAQARLEAVLKRLSRLGELHVCMYGVPYGVTPLELADVFPLAQTEITLPTDHETFKGASEILKSYIERSPYRALIFYRTGRRWERDFLTACKASEKKLITFQPSRGEAEERTIDRLLKAIRELGIRAKRGKA